MKKQIVIFLVLAIAAFAWAAPIDYGDQIKFTSGQPPQIQIGEGKAIDQQIVLDGNAQDYYECLDDSADDYIVGGKGSTCGTTPMIALTNDSSATAADKVVLSGSTSETNGIVDVYLFKLDSTGTPANNLGMGISFQVDDATPGVEEQASLDIVVTDVTTTSENADITWSANTEGTIREVYSIDSQASASTGTIHDFTAWTIETNGVIDMVKFALDNTADTATDGFGLGMSFVLEDEEGAQTQAASLDIVETDSANASLDVDFIFSQRIDGAITETYRLDASTGGIPTYSQIDADSAGTATTTSIKHFYYIESCADQSDATVCFTLPQVTTTGMVKCAVYSGTDKAQCSWIVDENGAVLIANDPHTQCDDANTDAKMNVIDGGGTVAIVNNRLGQTESILCEMIYD